MHIIVAPDSFKGSISALHAARAIGAGLEEAGHTDIRLLPIADGGEGTVEALCVATRGVVYTHNVHDPIGRKLDAPWGVLGDGHTAVIEIAAASGYERLMPDKFAPMEASTYGTGELIRAAINHGCKRIIIGLGGSATTDGGAGIAQALGFRLLDAAGREIKQGGIGLLDLAQIDSTEAMPELAGTSFVVACDVDNPLCGEKGAAAIFGPQKGANAQQVLLLDRALGNFARIVQKDLGKTIGDTPGAGAAGGAGGGLMGLVSATLVPGFQLVSQECDLPTQIAHADIVFTGEGKTDHTTLFGKVPMGIGSIAKKHHVPVICISGGLSEGWKALYDHGITACFSICDGAISLEDAMARGVELLRERACALGRILACTKII